MPGSPGPSPPAPRPAGQCHGLAGDAELLLDLAALPGGNPAGNAAVAAAEALLLQRRIAAGGTGTVFADDSGATLSAGFGTGLAGTGAFLLRLVAGGPRLLMLDALISGDSPGPPGLVPGTQPSPPAGPSPPTAWPPSWPGCPAGAT